MNDMPELKHDYQKALRAWMGVGHGGDPDDIHAIHSALTIAAKLRQVGFQYKFQDQMSGHPVWRNNMGPWNGQEPSATREIFIIDEIPLDVSSPKTPETELNAQNSDSTLNSNAGVIAAMKGGGE